MKLLDIAKFTEVIKMKDTFIIDETTNDIVEKNEIGHFVILHHAKPELWEEEKPKKRGGRRKKVVVEEADTTTVEDDADTISCSNEQLLDVVAKQLNISQYSFSILKDNGWFICPVFKEMYSLRPIEVVKNTKNYTLVIKEKPLCEFNGSDIMQGSRPNDFRYNAMNVIYSAINEFQIPYIVPKSVYRLRKDNRDLVELRSVVAQCELLMKTRIKVGNNINSLVFTLMGRTKFIELKETILCKKKKKDSVTEKESLAKGGIGDISLLDPIVKKYKEIEEYTSENNIIIKNPKTFEPFKCALIPSFMIYCLVEEYVNMLNIETKMEKVIELMVKDQPIYQNYLVGIKGVGFKNAAYLIAYLDIYKADHPSSFLKYVGLDQVPVTPILEDGEVINEDRLFNIFRLLMRDYELINERSVVEGIPVDESSFISNKFATDAINGYAEYLFVKALYHQFNKEIEMYKNSLTPSELVQDIMVVVNKNKVAKEMVERIVNKFQVDIVDSIYGKDTPLIRKRARKMSDREVVPYLTANGEIKLKSYLGYNSALKARLLGIMATGFNMAKGGYYKVYSDYKQRLLARNDADKFTKTHIERKALRFTMQIFLEDLWIAWRTLEGLPLNGGTYREEKLKLYHKNRSDVFNPRPGLQPQPQRSKTSKTLVLY